MAPRFTPPRSRSYITAGGGVEEHPEIAAALNMGSRSVDREWQIARAWLFERLSSGDTADGDAR